MDVVHCLRQPQRMFGARFGLVDLSGNRPRQRKDGVPVRASQPRVPKHAAWFVQRAIRTDGMKTRPHTIRAHQPADARWRLSLSAYATITHGGAAPEGTTA